MKSEDNLLESVLSFYVSVSEIELDCKSVYLMTHLTSSSFSVFKTQFHFTCIAHDDLLLTVILFLNLLSSGIIGMYHHT